MNTLLKSLKFFIAILLLFVFLTFPVLAVSDIYGGTGSGIDDLYEEDMPEQHTAEWDAYWYEGDQLMKWDLETGKTVPVEGIKVVKPDTVLEGWSEDGDFYEFDATARRTTEVSGEEWQEQYTGQTEGHWAHQGKVYWYNPDTKKAEVVSTTGYYMIGGAVYYLDPDSDGEQKPIVISYNPCWYNPEDGKFYLLNKNNEFVEVSAAEYYERNNWSGCFETEEGLFHYNSDTGIRVKIDSKQYDTGDGQYYYWKETVGEETHVYRVKILIDETTGAESLSSYAELISTKDYFTKGEGSEIKYYRVNNWGIPYSIDPVSLLAEKWELNANDAHGFLRQIVAEEKQAYQELVDKSDDFEGVIREGLYEDKEGNLQLGFFASDGRRVELKLNENGEAYIVPVSVFYGSASGSMSLICGGYSGTYSNDTTGTVVNEKSYTETFNANKDGILSGYGSASDFINSAIDATAAVESAKKQDVELFKIGDAIGNTYLAFLNEKEELVAILLPDGGVDYTYGVSGLQFSVQEKVSPTVDEALNAVPDTERDKMFQDGVQAGLKDAGSVEGAVTDDTLNKAKNPETTGSDIGAETTGSDMGADAEGEQSSGSEFGDKDKDADKDTYFSNLSGKTVAEKTALSEGWRCDGKTRYKQNSEELEVCEVDCKNGVCIEAACDRLTCSYSYSKKQCGSFSDGCNGTIDCSQCPAGLDCVSGTCKCNPKTECSAESKCGFEEDGCGGKISCGQCKQGFQCNAYWHECVPEQEKATLELSGITVYNYSTYAVISWMSSMQADSVLYFGETEALGKSRNVARAAKNHSIVVDGLRPSTTYYYRAEVSDSGRKAQSEVRSFKTLGTGSEDAFRLLFVAVDPPGKAEYEGYSFGFTAVTSALDQGDIEFDWDFGDGSKAEKAGYSFYHSYYGLTSEEKEFVVKVTARDSQGNEDSIETTITVLKAAFKPIVLKPRLFESVSKEEELEISLAFLDREDERISCGEISLLVTISDRVIEMSCDEDFLFSGKTKLGEGVNEMQLLAISARYTDEKKHDMKTRVPIYFEPIKINSTDAFEGKEYFLNQSLESEKVKFKINNFRIVNPLELSASLVSTAGEKEVKISKSGKYDYEIEFDHVVTEEDLVNGLTLRLEGKDSSGNRIVEFQKVPVGSDNPELTILVTDPSDEEETFVFGQEAVIRAKILSNKFVRSGENIFISCEELGLNEAMDYDSFSREYSKSIVLPEKGEADVVLLKLYASAFVDEEKLETVEFIELKLSDELFAEFVVPAPKKTLILGESIEQLQVRLLQSNGKLFVGGPVEAEFVVDGEMQKLLLEFDEFRGLHYTVLDKPIMEGAHSFKLFFTGAFSGESEQIFSNVQFDPFLANIGLVLVVIVGVVVIVVVGSSTVGRMGAEKKILLNEKKRLLGLKKKYKFEFFKRHISEKEYHKNAKHVEEGLVFINRLLKSKYYVKVGVLKAVFRSRDPKKLPDFLQVSSLVIKLAGRRGEFSRSEIARAIAEEKYPGKVNQKVLEKLFG